MENNIKHLNEYKGRWYHVDKQSTTQEETTNKCMKTNVLMEHSFVDEEENHILRPFELHIKHMLEGKKDQIYDISNLLHVIAGENHESIHKRGRNNTFNKDNVFLILGKSNNIDKYH